MKEEKAAEEATKGSALTELEVLDDDDDDDHVDDDDEDNDRGDPPDDSEDDGDDENDVAATMTPKERKKCCENHAKRYTKTVRNELKTIRKRHRLWI